MKNGVTHIYKSTVKLMAPLTPEGTYTTIVEEAIKLLHGKYGTLFLLDDGDNFARIYSNVPQELRFTPRPTGFTRNVFKSSKPALISRKKLISAHPQFEKHPIQLMVMIPLCYEDKAFGILNIHLTDQKKFNRDKMQTIQLFGTLASLKLRNDFLFSELKTALETRDLFISMASHELKTPLTTISAFSQLIKKTVEKQKSIQTSWVETLVASTQRLTRLIDELLHVNQIKTGKFTYQFEKSSVKKVIKRALVEFKTLHKEYSVIFNEKTKGLSVIADQDKLVQVLINILNNAAKFSAPEKEIVIELSAEKKLIVISITDQGEGIAEEEIPLIFKGFYRSQKNKKTEGLGLGLFITNAIVKEHKGSIQVVSQPGKGTTFTVSLPQINEE